MVQPDIDVNIRQATEADAEILRELRLEALLTHPEVFAADYQADLNKSLSDWQMVLQRDNGTNSVIYLACADALPVGMIGLFRGGSGKTKHSGTIWGVYVRSNFRRYGIGKRLIESCIHWAKARSIKVIKLAVISPNTSAIQCYAKCGFRVYGIEPQAIFYDSTYYDEVLMVREVEPSS
jgi:GNAT superfamily N-acetyltransferase